MVPEGWQIKRLGQVATLQRGFDLPRQARVEGPYPIVSSSGISGYHDSFQVEPPGVVTGRSGTIGEVFFLEQPFWPLNTSLWVKDFHDNDPRFIYYLLSSVGLERFRYQTGVPGVNRNDIHEHRVLLPPVKEQRAIAALLDTWEAAKEQTETIISALHERKRGLMQLLLTGKKRFKEYDSVPWKKASLSQLGRVASGGTPSTSVPDYWNGEHAWCTPSEVTALESRFIESTARRITEEGLRASAAELLPPGSLIVCTRATIGDCAINAVPMAMNQGFKAIVPRDGVDVEFLYYKLVHSKPALLRLANGSTFLEVSKRDFEGLEIEVPCLEEQKKIATVLSTADAEIENLEMQLAAYRLQKRGLMQQLLTGKKRVNAHVPEAVPA